MSVLPQAGHRARDIIRKTLQDEDSFATCIVAIILDNYGAEAFTWEVESIVHELETDFQAKIPPVNIDKMMALIVAMTTNQFNVSWEVFSQTCRALDGTEADFSTFEPLDPEELIWGVAEVAMNVPPSDDPDDTDFSHEVAQYAGLVLYENGVFDPPKILSWVELPFANPTLALETAFTDDPDMFQAAQLNQKLTREALEEYLARKIKALHAALAELPLRNRDTSAA